jgi:hypothetical protein
MRDNLVKRSELPTVREVHHGDMHYYLGVLKEFIKDDRMRDFLPKDLPVSLAWVRLEKDEVLEAHTHPVHSMILVCEGTARSFGELECALEEGDAVLVRSGHAHGFVGGSPSGFWGLSLQFEARGLYEDLDDPWVSFKDHESHNVDNSTCASLTELLARNRELADRFAKVRIFAAAERGGLDDGGAKSRLLDCIQVWLRHVQEHPRAMPASAAADAAITALNAALAHGDRRPIRDPGLEALCSWFLWKAGSMNTAERVVLSSLVLDAAMVVLSHGLHPYVASKSSPAPGPLTAKDWNDIGTVLEAAGVTDWTRLAKIQRDAWDTANALLGRIATLVLR